MEYLIVERRVAEYLVQMVTVSISNKYLTEAVAGHQTHNLLHTACIQLVKDIIEQQ